MPAAPQIFSSCIRLNAGFHIQLACFRRAICSDSIRIACNAATKACRDLSDSLHTLLAPCFKHIVARNRFPASGDMRQWPVAGYALHDLQNPDALPGKQFRT
jgi:hypothetical protein